MKNVKKPCVIISSYDDVKNPYYAGGGAIAIHEVARRLTDKYVITVITGKYPKAINKTIDGVRYERVGLTHGGPFIGQVFFSLALPFQVMTRSFDVWLESFTPPFSTNCLQLFTRKPVIGLVHMLSGEDMRRKYKLPFDKIEYIGLQTYRQAIVLSETVKKKLTIVNPKLAVTVIPNGVDTVALRTKNLHNKKNKKYLLCIGRIEINQKGLDLLLNAYKTFSNKENYPLLIAGSGTIEERKKLQKLIMQLSLSKHVKLLGKASGKKKEKLYQEATCVIVPSRFETFSLTALEAMAHAKPLITFNLSGLVWIPSQCRITVKTISTNQLAKAIDRLVSDQELQKSIGMIAFQFSKSFSWDSIAGKYDEVIQSRISGQV